MRLRNIKGSKEIIGKSNYVIQKPDQLKGCWEKQFGNDHPIHIEVGMGKGRFIMDLAAQNPEINYLGIEMYDSVLLRALQKREQEELSNLYFLCVDAQLLPEIFAPGEVARIYLNFSDPWPKERHAKRRLTSRNFLHRYDQFLTQDGWIEFKTDNRGLFDFSLEEVKETNWELMYCTIDLHQDEKLMEGNIMTEYEEKFSLMGNPIHKMEIRRAGADV
jgi:tRNA (guanine-N7-)-methyltransferase